MSEPATVGRYQLLSPLGRGAMGVVYRAHDPQLERDVAVKLIALAEGTGEEAFAETSGRFSREARVAARIHHPNVVTVYDAGESGDRLFLVMELVEGEALSSRLSRGEFPDRDQSLEIAAQAADALAAAHLAGIVHRDVKPGNILLSSRGQVKVSDFGVARAVGETTELTRTGMMVGSPAYMAPEQVSGRALDGRADLFSLGVVLYEMLLHRKPFPADTLTTLIYQILHQDPLEEEAVLGQLDPGVADLLQRTLGEGSRNRESPDAATFAPGAAARRPRQRGSQLVPFARGAPRALRCRRRATRLRRRPNSWSGSPIAGASCRSWRRESCSCCSPSSCGCADRRRLPNSDSHRPPESRPRALAQPLAAAPAPEPPVAEAKAPEPADEEDRSRRRPPGNAPPRRRRLRSRLRRRRRKRWSRPSASRPRLGHRRASARRSRDARAPSSPSIRRRPKSRSTADRSASPTTGTTPAEGRSTASPVPANTSCGCRSPATARSG
ncbi:MAG: serine/threonine-protein kinase [Thermoanaerobaculia bacterium]